MTSKTLKTWLAVQDLTKKNFSQRKIASELGMAKSTVNYYQKLVMTSVADEAKQEVLPAINSKKPIEGEVEDSENKGEIYEDDLPDVIAKRLILELANGREISPAMAMLSKAYLDFITNMSKE